MKPNFALDLSHEGINLLHRSKGGWTLVGSVALDDPDMGGRLEDLRRSAAMLESGGLTAKIIIPDSQILYTTLDAPGPDDISREVQIRAALDGLTPYPVGELVFDWRAEGDKARVAVLARETMDEAESFAVQHKFNPVSFVARPGRGKFSGEPFFGKTRAAATILPAGERVEPDSTPVPRNPAAKELPESARVDDHREQTPESGTPEAGPVPEPADAPVPDTTAPLDPNDPFADLDRLAAELSGDETTPQAAPPPKPRRKRRDETPRVGPPQLAPFPPTPDEAEASARPFMPRPEKPAEPRKPTPRRAPPAAPSGTETKPEATPAMEEARPLSAPDTTSATPEAGPETNTAEPSVSFSSTRASARGSSDAEETAPGERVAGIAPRIGISGRKDDTSPPTKPSTSEDRPRVMPPTPAPRPDRLRAGMAEALAKPLPKAGEPSEAAQKGPGIFGRATGAARAALAARSAAREARKAEAAEAALARRVPPKAEAVPAPAPDEAPAKKGFLPSRGPKDAGRKRDREAEALTVFGARKTQAPDRPKYLGLILTLVLLLAMAAVAVWSSFLVEDDEANLFNPGPAVVTEEADAPPATTGATPAETADAPPAPEPPLTAEVLSAEEAVANYAATGIWQRAPDAPQEPETTRLDPFEMGDLGAAVAARSATPLPDLPSGVTADAALADPVPPPPPGTSFDLDESGLVIATPEGALSPTGILVYAGRPPLVPPAPPPGLLPAAPAPDVEAPVPATPEAEAGTVTDAALEAAVEAASEQPEIAEPLATEPFALPDVPRLRPTPRPATIPPALAPAETPLEAPAAEPLPEAAEPESDAEPEDNASLLRPAPRPEDLAAPVTDTAAIDAAVDDAVAAALVNPTELAVAASRKPSARPANFEKIVASAQASASDGSTVVAAASATPASVATAPATISPAIPTSASVATQATTKNALNLREINLIGIYGSSSDRRALVRLENGRYLKVEVGDRLDGGKVTSITASRLTYQKGSRAYTLEVLPLG